MDSRVRETDILREYTSRLPAQALSSFAFNRSGRPFDRSKSQAISLVARSTSRQVRKCIEFLFTICTEVGFDQTEFAYIQTNGTAFHFCRNFDTARWDKHAFCGHLRVFGKLFAIGESIISRARTLSRRTIVPVLKSYVRTHFRRFTVREFHRNICIGTLRFVGGHRTTPTGWHPPIKLGHVCYMQTEQNIYSPSCKVKSDLMFRRWRRNNAYLAKVTPIQDRPRPY